MRVSLAIFAVSVAAPAFVHPRPMNPQLPHFSRNSEFPRTNQQDQSIPPEQLSTSLPDNYPPLDQDRVALSKVDSWLAKTSSTSDSPDFSDSEDGSGSDHYSSTYDGASSSSPSVTSIRSTRVRSHGAPLRLELLRHMQQSNNRFDESQSDISRQASFRMPHDTINNGLEKNRNNPGRDSSGYQRSSSSPLAAPDSESDSESSSGGIYFGMNRVVLPDGRKFSYKPGAPQNHWTDEERQAVAAYDKARLREMEGARRRHRLLETNESMSSFDTHRSGSSVG